LKALSGKGSILIQQALDQEGFIVFCLPQY